MKKAIVLGCAVGSFASVWASGFGLYEPSSAATSLGGALLGKAYDASANTINPATLTDLTNVTVQAGLVTEHPRARMKYAIDDGDYGRSHPMDPGFFVLPHFQLAVPLPADFAFGLGITPEYGLGTSYASSSPMTWNSKDTTIQGFVINPNLAYKVTDKWSLGAGLRQFYFDFDQYSYPMAYSNPYGTGTMKNHLRGNNGFRDFGGRFGTTYRLFDNFAVGAMYQTRIVTHVKGHSRTTVSSDPLHALGNYYNSGTAKANMNVPQAVGFGFNWDITDDWHFGAMCSWTQWSEFDTLKFNLPTGVKPIRLDWKDTWRFGFAPSWDFAEDWTVMTSYVYDSNTCPSDQTSTMLPPGDRHILTWGLAWRLTENLELDFNYGIVLMGSGSMHTVNSVDGKTYRMESHRGLSHAAGGSIIYRF